jgi:hypothetical protein
MRQGAAWPSSAGESPKDDFDGEHPNRIFYPNSPAEGKPQAAPPKQSLTKRFFLPKTGRGSHVVGESELRVNRHPRTSPVGGGEI